MAARDRATYDHSQRVRQHAKALVEETGIGDAQFLHTLQAAALLHDVGKLGIPDRLLDKPGPLTPTEYDQVKQHSVMGADFLSGVRFPGPLALFVRHHHENWDGTGYPDHRRREDIPAGARVLAIVDCYDALTSDRPYRRALAREVALAMIADRRGSMFDPHLTDAFLQLVGRLRPAPADERPSTRQPPARALCLVEARAR